MGEMYLFENFHELHFLYDITEVKHNLIKIKENKVKINGLCDQQTPIMNCQFFVNYVNEEIVQIEKDLIKLRAGKDRKRRRRRAFKESIFDSVNSLLENEHSLTERNNEFTTNLKFLKELIRAIKEMLKELSENGSFIDQRMSELDKACMFQELLSVTNSLIASHRANMNRIETIFGDMKKYFFNIINVNEFVNEVRGLNSTLNNNLELPRVHILELIHTAKIQTVLYETHIFIMVRIPLVSNNTYTMGKFVPIPVTKRDGSVIIDTKIRQFVSNERDIYEISPENLTKCTNIRNITICNSLIEHVFRKPDECMSSYMKNKSVECCKIMEVEHKNQIIEISKTSIFIYLVSPIEIKIINGGIEKLIEMRESDVINFSEGSEIIVCTNRSRKTSITQKILNFTTLSYNFYIDNFDESKWQLKSLILSKSQANILQLENKIDLIKDNEENNDQKGNYFLSIIYDIVSDQLFIDILIWSCKWLIAPYVLYRVLKNITKNCCYGK